MSVSPIRRPRYTRRSILYTVQRIANEIAKANGGKVPDVFQIDARLKQELIADPDLLDLDKACRDMRKHWERANNIAVNSRAGGILYVPGAYVSVGKRMRGQMVTLDPITDAAAWMQQDDEASRNFNATMDRRKRYQLQIIQEGTINRDCKTLGELETKLRGWTPTPDDDAVFRDGEDDGDDDAAAAGA